MQQVLGELMHEVAEQAQIPAFVLALGLSRKGTVPDGQYKLLAYDFIESAEQQDIRLWVCLGDERVRRLTLPRDTFTPTDLRVMRSGPVLLEITSS